jgi:hypothetical protein
VTEDRFPLPAVYAVLLVLGAALGVWCAFLVPVRLPGGIEGLADVVALVGNLLIGAFAARGTRELLSAAMPGIGWLVTVLVLLTLHWPPDEVVVPGALGADLGIGTVGNLFIFAGAGGAILAVVLGSRFIRTGNRPRLAE